MKSVLLSGLCVGGLILMAGPGDAATFFNTGTPDGSMASASRPGGVGSFEIETADDFITSTTMSVTSATFTGLLPTGASVSNVTVEIYRVFPNDSNVSRTTGSPLFATAAVPTRVNSPSDVATTSGSSSDGTLSFSTTTLNASFTANNSVQPGGIHPAPLQTTGGNGSVTGQEVLFNVTFAVPLNLSADHYFFVPQVQLSTGDFLWLSAPRPVSGGTGPFNPDLQGWARDQFLDPDWLRVGTDIIGGNPAPTFNFAFSLDGVATPLPAALPLFAGGAGMFGLLGWRKRRKIKHCNQLS